MPNLFSAVLAQLRLGSTKAECLERALQLLDGYVLYAGLEIACRLVVFPEFFLQPARGAHIKEKRAEPRQIFVPGEETERLGEKAKKHNIYIIGTAEVFEPDFPGQTFNVAFIIAPNGRVVHKYYKLMTTNNAMETNVSPHDVYDWFVQQHGDSLQAFFPVADTEIGRIGIFTCYDGNFPEIPRGLAMNGAEILVRPAAWPDPYNAEPADFWSLQNRMRALENTCYLLGVNQGGGGYAGTDINAGFTMIVDYKGRILNQCTRPGDSVIYGTLNIAELREFRARARSYNFLPSLRTEVFQKIYAEPVWPKNMWLSAPAPTIMGLNEGFERAKATLRERRVFVG